MQLFQTKQLSEALAQVGALNGQLANLKAAVEKDGHFALTAGEDGKFTVSLTDAGKASFAAEIADLTAKLTDATASAEALASEKLALEGKLGTAAVTERQRIGAAVDADGLFKLAYDAEGKPTLSLAAADGFFALAPGADGKLALSLTEAGKVQFVNDEATRITATTGHRQMPLAVDKNALGNGGATTGNTGAGRTKITWNK